MLTVSKMRTLNGFGIGEQTAMGRLRFIDGAGEAPLLFGGATIALIDKKECALRLFCEGYEEILGFVYLGAYDEEISSAAISRGISGIFTELDGGFIFTQDEIAILYPQKDRLILSPDIEMLERFTEEIQSERRSADVARSCCEYFYVDSEDKLYGLLPEENCGTLVNVPLRSLCEEELFALFTEIVEFSDGKESVICLSQNNFDHTSIDSVSRALMRAASCGRIRVAISAQGSKTLDEHSSSLKAAERSLLSEGEEFDEIISRGIIIDSLDSLIYTMSSSGKLDTVVIDIEKLYGQRATESLNEIVRMLSESRLRRTGRLILIDSGRRADGIRIPGGKRNIFTVS